LSSPPPEVFPVRSLTVTENDVALPAERGNLEYAGLSLVYEGNRVKSALLGRDLNPLGRGDTSFYPVGALSLKNVTPKGLTYVWMGNGNSVNNQDQGGIGSSPSGNFDAAGMLKCGQSLYPGRMCPLCPVLQVHPCLWTTPDELCECMRQSACAAYECWYNNPYCCENVYRFCSCLCGEPLDCLVGGCGGNGGGGGGGNGGNGSSGAGGSSVGCCVCPKKKTAGSPQPPAPLQDPGGDPRAGSDSYPIFCWQSCPDGYTKIKPKYWWLTPWSRSCTCVRLPFLHEDPDTGALDFAVWLAGKLGDVECPDDLIELGFLDVLQKGISMICKGRYTYMSGPFAPEKNGACMAACCDDFTDPLPTESDEVVTSRWLCCVTRGEQSSALGNGWGDVGSGCLLAWIRYLYHQLHAG
jgi:hypothetical protein